MKKHSILRKTSTGRSKKTPVNASTKGTSNKKTIATDDKKTKNERGKRPKLLTTARGKTSNKAKKQNTSAAKPIKTISHRKIKKALGKLSKAQTVMTAQGIELLNLANDLGRSAVEAHNDALMMSVLDDNLLISLKDTLLKLGEASEHTLTIEAVLNWLSRHLELSEHLKHGQRLEVAADRLNQFEIEGDSPPSPAFLVQIQVIVPGWKRRGKMIIPPKVSIVQPEIKS